MKRVVVTGANGHLGYSLVKLLKERDYSVRATVRDLKDTKKIANLQALGVETMEADLTDPRSLERALEGMEGLFQVAANFNLNARDPEREVIRVNVDGTRNVLEAAARAGIQKVIYTSSVASVGTIAPGENPLDESNWNDAAVEPYAISKTRSERLAWELSRSLGLNLVTILPGTIIGPDFYRLTSSLEIMRELIKGKIPMALPMELSYVDVRDVALAHILAFENPGASGRYIATNRTLPISGVIEMVRDCYPGLKASSKTMPAWVARMLPALDWITHRLTGAPRQMKSETMREYLNRSQSYSLERIHSDLGWSPRPVEKSIQETIDWLLRPEFQFLNG